MAPRSHGRSKKRVIRVDFAMSALFPLYPRTRTSLDAVGMSQRCHKLTASCSNAVQFEIERREALLGKPKSDRHDARRSSGKSPNPTPCRAASSSRMPRTHRPIALDRSQARCPTPRRQWHCDPKYLFSLPAFCRCSPSPTLHQLRCGIDYR